MSIGLAYRNARNQYLPQDAEWLVQWSPLLVTTGIKELDAEIFKDMSRTADSGLDPTGRERMEAEAIATNTKRNDNNTDKTF